MIFRLSALLVAQVAVFSFSGQAGVVSLLDHGELGDNRTVLVALPKPSEAGLSPASVFTGKAKGSMFANRPARLPAFPKTGQPRLLGSDIDILRALIQEAESRRDGYDAVQHGAKIKTPRLPTQMTIEQIYKWIADTPGQPHAIGRYQFIPKTLVRVVKKAGIDPKQRFTPAVQDKLADVLLAEAGFHRFRAGKLPRKDFMNNLAKIWAGFPNSTGKSHYEGYAGNKASISWSRFDAVMAKIAPS